MYLAEHISKKSSASRTLSYILGNYNGSLHDVMYEIS